MHWRKKMIPPLPGPRLRRGCHGLGKLSRRTGKREQAQEHLTTASTKYSEMEMTYWLEQAEREMRELT